MLLVIVRLYNDIPITTPIIIDPFAQLGILVALAAVYNSLVNKNTNEKKKKEQEKETQSQKNNIHEVNGKRSKDPTQTS